MTRSLGPVLLTALLSCAHAAPHESVAALADLKAKVMAADYRGDFADLRTLRAAAQQWHKDPELGHLAYYWSGFASWRIAINGANHQMPRAELVKNLRDALIDFYAAIHANAEFGDGYAAAAGAGGWMAGIAMTSTPTPDLAGAKERVVLARAMLARAKQIDPQNPRMLWVEGGWYLFLPPEKGGSLEKAMETYQRAIAAVDRTGMRPTSPEPDWGKPEALMSMAWMHVNKDPIDARVALEEARRALALQPHWSYVRDILVPQIEQKLRR